MLSLFRFPLLERSPTGVQANMKNRLANTVWISLPLLLFRLSLNYNSVRVVVVILIGILWSRGGVAQQRQPSEIFLVGRISEESGLPLADANISVEEYRLNTFSNESGEFRLVIPAHIKRYTLRITSVGKKTHTQVLTNDRDRAIEVTLRDNSLTLDSLTINSTYTQGVNSISSITFDEEAIERIQAFSLMDILNTLPGKKVTAPNLNVPQTLTLRNTLGGIHDYNNSLGIPIIIDGVTLSNDANMQSRPISQWGMGLGALPATRNANTADVPFRGIDLREIPVESIERIEVIQGVASAEYGELTDGAILIERKAGKMPLQFTANVNATTYNYSLNKGFNLPKKWGGLTVDANYAISNSNPTTNFQEYRRYGLGIRWNTTQYRYFRNKLSIDYNSKIDEGKLDPDDADKYRYYSTDKGFRFSNTMSFTLPNKWVNSINLITSLSMRDQESYAQRQLNQGIKMFANKDTTGIYEGIVMNAQYLSVEEIIGSPVTASANLKFHSNFSILSSRHTMSYGISSNYTNNGGKGIVSDPDLPRFFNFSNQNSRPYAFTLTPDVINYGLYISDNIRYDWLGKPWSSNVGMRIDAQNGSWSLQPRINTQVSLTPKLNVAAAYGISAKSPTLAQIYPTPAWLDIPLVTATSTQYSPVYLVYTHKMQTSNLDLKPMRNSQAEINLGYNEKSFSARLNAYYKNVRDGFNSRANYMNITVPVYDYYADDDLQKIVYQQTGDYKTIKDITYNTIENTESSYTYGFDWSVSIPRIPYIHTSLSTSTSYIISKENNVGNYDALYLKTPVSYQGNNIWYVLYDPQLYSKRYILTSKLNTTTHIPKLGFVIMTNTDIFWKNNYGSLHKNEYQEALGYLDQDMHMVFIERGNGPSLPPRNIELTSGAQKIIYANFSVSVAKEIGKKLRIAITTYNTFNSLLHRSDKTSNGVEQIVYYNAPLSITGGISLKL